MNKKIVSFAVFALVLMLATPGHSKASAATTSDPKLMGTFGDWSAYSYKDGDKNVCYILSTPKKAAGGYKKRGEVFTLVTHRPAEKSRNVFSVMAGYSYKSDSNVNVTIDKQKFVLFTHNDSAWTPDPATDTRLTTAMKKGKEMVITGTPEKGNMTTDTYGLKGIGEAFAAINKACAEN